MVYLTGVLFNFFCFISEETGLGTFWNIQNETKKKILEISNLVHLYFCGKKVAFSQGLF